MIEIRKKKKKRIPSIRRWCRKALTNGEKNPINTITRVIEAN